MGGKYMTQAIDESRRSTKQKNEQGFLNMIGSFYAQVVNGQDIRTEEDKILETIKLAHEEWNNAEAFFQNVTDPDLIDHAIYRVEAAKTRYAYLMKIARQMDINSNFHSPL